MPQKRTWAQSFGKAARRAYPYISALAKKRMLQKAKSLVTPTRRRRDARNGVRSSNKPFVPGHYAGRFKRPSRKVKKIEYPCIVRDQRAWSTTSADSCYVIHCSHPIRYVYRMLCMAMVHKYFASVGVVIRNWNNIAGYQNFLGAAGENQYELECKIVYKIDTSDTTPLFARLFLNERSVTTRSFLETADVMAEALLALIGTSSSCFTIVELQWTNAITNNVGVGKVPNVCVWDALEIEIVIDAMSTLSCQNRTVAGDVGGSANTNNIFSNPLVGKHYTLKGQGALVRDYGYDVVNTSQQFTPGASSGFLAIGVNASSINATARDALLEPPYGNYFRSCSKTSTVRLEPGAIKESVVKATVKKSLNHWIKATLPAAQLAIDYASLPMVNASYGESKMFGLEKVADMGSSDVAIAGERNAVYKSKMTFRKRRFTVPTSEQIA